MEKESLPAETSVVGGRPEETGLSACLSQGDCVGEQARESKVQNKADEGGECTNVRMYEETF